MSKRNMVISLIGRPNVGKSSIFNALMKQQNKAMTFDMPGVTRDRHYGIATFKEMASEDAMDAIVVDTGGFYPTDVEEGGKTKQEITASKFFNIMTEHAQLAIEESDLVLFVVDVREGILPFDKTIANYIRSTKKEFWLLINKYDTHKQAGSEAEFYTLGLPDEEMFVVSAAHGHGMMELKQRLHKKALDFHFSNDNKPALQKGVTPKEKVVARLALIGAPNAGKSTLLNQLLGAERALVSDIPGTTVDPIEGYFDIYFGKDACELEEEVKFSREDHILQQKYEEFRQNNPEFYETIASAYNREEEFHGDHGIYEGELDEEMEDLDEEFVAEMEAERDDELLEQSFENESDDVEEINELEETEEAPEGSLWRTLHLVDTAGIRRRKSIEGFVEEQSVYRSLRCITESDIIIFMVDSTKGVAHQDRRLLDIALDKGKSVIVCLNKFDLVKDKYKTEKEKREWIKDIRYDLPWLNFCDIITISAKEGKGLKALKNSIKKTIFVRRRPIPTSQLNRVSFSLFESHPIVIKRSNGRRLKVKYTSQIKSNPPTFLFYTNRSKGIPVNYKRYLRNGLRGNFGLDNTPIHLIFRTGTDLENRMNKMN